jgi:hypothetical protein
MGLHGLFQGKFTFFIHPGIQDHVVYRAKFSLFYLRIGGTRFVTNLFGLAIKLQVRIWKRHGSNPYRDTR